MELKKYKYKFYIEAYGGSLKDAIPFESKYTDTPNYIAEDAATCFFENYDGWESSWPLVFSIFTMKNRFIGDFEIELESTPVFTATKIRK